jgi:hypothetical protein
MNYHEVLTLVHIIVKAFRSNSKLYLFFKTSLEAQCRNNMISFLAFCFEKHTHIGIHVLRLLNMHRIKTTRHPQECWLCCALLRVPHLEHLLEKTSKKRIWCTAERNAYMQQPSDEFTLSNALSDVGAQVCSDVKGDGFSFLRRAPFFHTQRYNECARIKCVWYTKNETDWLVERA